MKENYQNILLIFFSFFILFFINPNWFYLEIGGPDQWAALMYVERFDNFYPDILGARTSRFGWLIPGQFFINKFNDLGIILFPALYFLITIFTYYFTLKLFFNLNISLFLSLFALSYMELHGSYGWLYMSNFSLTYLIISIYFFFKGLKNNKQNFLFISGFFSAIAILTYSTTILFFILFPILLFLNSQGKIKKFLINCLIYLLGFSFLVLLSIIYFYLRYDIFLIDSHFLKFQIPFIFSSFDYTIYFSLKWKQMLNSGWSSPNLFHYLVMAPSYALCMFVAIVSTYLLIKEKFFLRYLRVSNRSTKLLFSLYALLNHSIQVLYALLSYLLFQNSFLYPKHHFFLVLGLSTILALSAIIYLLKNNIFDRKLKFSNKVLFLLFPGSLIFFYFFNNQFDEFLFFGENYFFIIIICILFLFILFKTKFKSFNYIIIFLIFMNIQSSSGKPPVGKAISYYNYDRCSYRKDLFMTAYGITSYLNSIIENTTNYHKFLTSYSFVFDQEDKLNISSSNFCNKVHEFYSKNGHPVYDLWSYKKPLMLIGESVQYYFENKYKEPQQFLILNYWNSSSAKHQSLNTLLEQSVNNEDHRIVFISTEDNKKNYLKLIENEKNFQFKEIDTKKFRNNNISVEVIIFSYKKIKNE